MGSGAILKFAHKTNTLRKLSLSIMLNLNESTKYWQEEQENHLMLLVKNVSPCLLEITKRIMRNIFILHAIVLIYVRLLIFAIILNLR